MPFIELNTNRKIELTIKDEIKTELGKLIEILPGKSENWLMVNINDEVSLYFKGTNDDSIMIKFLVYGNEIPSTILNKFTCEVTSYLSEKLNINSSRIYVSYFFTTNWGWNGSNF